MAEDTTRGTRLPPLAAARRVNGLLTASSEVAFWNRLALNGTFAGGTVVRAVIDICSYMLKCVKSGGAYAELFDAVLGAVQHPAVADSAFAAAELAGLRVEATPEVPALATALDGALRAAMEKEVAASTASALPPALRRPEALPLLPHEAAAVDALWLEVLRYAETGARARRAAALRELWERVTVFARHMRAFTAAKVLPRGVERASARLQLPYTTLVHALERREDEEERMLDAVCCFEYALTAAAGGYDAAPAAPGDHETFPLPAMARCMHCVYRGFVPREGGLDAARQQRFHAAVLRLLTAHRGCITDAGAPEEVRAALTELAERHAALLRECLRPRWE